MYKNMDYKTLDEKLKEQIIKTKNAMHANYVDELDKPIGPNPNEIYSCLKKLNKFLYKTNNPDYIVSNALPLMEKEGFLEEFENANYFNSKKNFKDKSEICVGISMIMLAPSMIYTFENPLLNALTVSFVSGFGLRTISSSINTGYKKEKDFIESCIKLYKDSKSKN